MTERSQQPDALRRRLGLPLLVLYGTGITVGAGIYVLDRCVIDLIVPGEPIDMPDLVRRAMERGRVIRVFVERTIFGCVDQAPAVGHHARRAYVHITRNTPLA